MNEIDAPRLSASSAMKACTLSRSSRQIRPNMITHSIPAQTGSSDHPIATRSGKRSELGLTVPEALRSRGKEAIAEAGHARVRLDASLVEQRPGRSAGAYRLQVTECVHDKLNRRRVLQQLAGSFRRQHQRDRIYSLR